MIIAIDGPAASGKGTLAKKLAAHFSLPLLDTGLLYRATARALLSAGAPLNDAAHATRAAQSLDIAKIDEHDLRGAAMGEAASVVAAIPSVRAALIDAQRRFANQPGGAVLDGRDIGTVIAPHANLKIFVTASPEVRADRRYKEALGRGEEVEYDVILADIRKRDERDSGRSAAPLKIAEDAVLLDTSAMSIEDVLAAAIRLVEAKSAAAKPPG
ncbi:(d)CMP kinase [Terrarubrum flagellatum]|uniref:(d)CMP kinase n=1 Tax=Terrirubrum flagellatum TaxID=2895980 RepID=UPI0031453956